MSYELDVNDILTFADTINGHKKEKGDELWFEHCPYCGNDSKDTYTFSVNKKTGAFNCFRASCSKQGHFVELARDFDFKLDFNDGRGDKEYKIIPAKEIIVRNEAIEYLKTRGISQRTAERYKITTQQKNKNILVFPFYNMAGQIEFVKYRNMKHVKGQGSKEWAETGMRPILFGMKQCNMEEKTLIICEGQIDSLSISECGIDNAVSVPIGVTGFGWVDSCWEWLENFNDVIVFGDNENGRMTLLNKIEKRLTARVRAVQMDDYLGEKDANAILQKYGQGAIINAIGNAKALPVNSVKDLSEVEHVSDHDRPKIKTNIKEIDRALGGGMRLGELIILTGKCGDGKSTFMSQLILEALEQNYNCFAYSGELADFQFKQWLDLQAAGAHNLEVASNEWQDVIYYVDKKTVEHINKWYKGRVFLYDNEIIDRKENEMEKLLKTIEKMIRRYDVKFICLDNLMTAVDVSAGDKIYSMQGEFVDALKKICKKYQVVVVLVAHPKKTKDELGNDDVSGNSDVTKLGDVVVTYSRDENKESIYDSLLGITKNRVGGRTAKGNDRIKLLYCDASKRISGESENKRAYGWEKYLK